MISDRIREFQNWVRAHPVYGSMAAMACLLFLTKPASLLSQAYLQGMAKELAGSLMGIAAAFLIVKLFGFDWLYRHGNAKETFLAGLPQLLFYGFLLGVYILHVIRDPELHWAEPAWILAGLLRLFQIGYLEEFVFRGIISNLLGFRFGKDIKGVWTAVLLSSAAFGLIHLSNVLNGVTFPNALLQSLIAFIMGICLCAVYYRGRSLWAMLVIHAVTDSLGIFNIYFLAGGNTGSSAEVINSMNPVSILYVMLYAMIAVFLLRKKKMDGVILAMDQAKAIDAQANA